MLTALQKILPYNLQVFNSALSGALSGLAMIVWPNVNVAMYILWKAIEVF